MHRLSCMTTFCKTKNDKEKLLKMFIGAVCNNLRYNDEELEETNSSGGPKYEMFKNKMLVANRVTLTDAKRDRAREAMNYWDSAMAKVQGLFDYVSLLKSTLALFDDDSKKNDVWIYPHKATQVRTRPPGPQRSNFAEVNTPVTVRNSGTVDLLLNRMHQLLE